MYDATFFRTHNKKSEPVPVLNHSVTPAIYIVGEDNHYSKKNSLFKNKLWNLVIEGKNNFFLGLEGTYFPDNFDDVKPHNFSGIQNKVVSYYADCVQIYISMNPENPHSKTMKPKIDRYVILAFLRLCQFVPRFISYNHDKDNNMRTILGRLYYQNENCRNFFDAMPGRELLSHSDSMKVEWYVLEWFSEHRNYILDKISSFSNVLQEITLALADNIRHNMPELANHVALSKETLSQVFSNKHAFKENAETTPLMELFLIDLKNQAWKKNMLRINSYAIAKGLPVIYVVGDSHMEGLERCLGHRHGEYRINYYPHHDMMNSPFCFLDDMGTKSSPDFSSKFKI